MPITEREWGIAMRSLCRHDQLQRFGRKALTVGIAPPEFGDLGAKIALTRVPDANGFE